MNSIFDIVRRWFRFSSKQDSTRQRNSDPAHRQRNGNGTNRTKSAPRPTQASESPRKQAIVSEVTAELLQDLRSASENRVKGPLWSLPRVNTGDPQPMLKHQAEALARLSQNDFHSRIIHLPTGSGKTRVGIEIAAQYLDHPQDRVIWATSGVGLLRQSVIRLVEMLGRFDRELAMRWAGSDHIQDDALFDEADVIFVTRDTLTKWLARAADGRIPDEPLRAALTARKGSRAARNVTLIYDKCHELGARGLQRAWKKLMIRCCRWAMLTIASRLSVVVYSLPIATPAGDL